MSYYHDVKVNGIDTRHYENPPDMFDLTTPENLCYCYDVSWKWMDDGCLDEYIETTSHFPSINKSTIIFNIIKVCI